MTWEDFNMPGIINGEEVESIADWFEENGDFQGGVDITIPEQEIGRASCRERVSLCV